MSLDNEQSKVIQGRFHLTRKLGAGSFGEIFEAKDLKTNKLYACKAESLRTKHPQLRLEYQIYRSLQSSKHFVRVWGYVTHYNHQIMIMDKLGDSLEQLFTSCGRKFSIRCVCSIAIQILSRIEELHKHNYLHRDIKPDNFLIGHTQNGDLTSKEAGKIYMIDLGLGKVWKEGGRHIPEKHGKRLIGTPRYASINTHFGHEQSRRDDLESLGYMLMYFAHGQLPWQGLRGQTKEEKYQKIGHKKRDTHLDELCRGYPREFREYLEATQKLGFQDDPPYEQYRLWFENVLKRQKPPTTPFDFDWQTKAHNKQIKSSRLKHSGSGNNGSSHKRGVKQRQHQQAQQAQPQRTNVRRSSNRNNISIQQRQQQRQVTTTPIIPQQITSGYPPNNGGNNTTSGHRNNGHYPSTRAHHSSTRQRTTGAPTSGPPRNTTTTNYNQQQQAPNNNNEESECNFCGLSDISFIENEENLDLHYWQSCPMLTSCKLCEQVIEIATLHEHILTECESKIKHRLCQKCNIPYSIQDNNNHKCVVDKNNNPNTNICPLCLSDIGESINCWKQHLLKYPGCKSNPRPLMQ
mmetsp:Transcript_9907/g.8908  ORF Transcript_9907/g.8908 Transcript_9907/m.8908 type:complete len:574 (+) Transcript_9907:301-2022(+)